MENQPTPLTVSQLNRRARQLLETHLPLVWVEGEISNFSRPGSGHWYLTLKDDSAQVRCAMFRNRNSLIKFRPESGDQVMVRCRVSIYEGRGDYQLIIEHMEEAGYGALQRQFDELKHRLHQEGLFSDDHKRPLPSLPNRIGLITSPTGAAIRDILAVIKRRFPAIPITVYPSIVQGKTNTGQTASSALAEQIELANNDNRCDVLILSRGGGSIEDLWAFNEENLARAIYHSEIPIISAVGHEVDFTIADFVADYRAPTPSAAAEILTPDGHQLMANFIGYEQLLTETITRRIQAHSQRVDSLARQLRHPGERIAHRQSQLGNLQLRLKQAVMNHLNTQQNRVQRLATTVKHHHPSQQLDKLQTQLNTLSRELQHSMKNLIAQKKSSCEKSMQLLHTVSPLNTLQRGYAIVLDEQQHVVRSVTETSPGNQLATTLSDGTLLCTVNQIIPEK